MNKPKKPDGRKNNGGARPGAGPKKMYTVEMIKTILYLPEAKIPEFKRLAAMARKEYEVKKE